MSSRAERHGDTYRLHGAKRDITYFDIADFFVIFAKADAGITAFALHNPVERIKLTRRSEC